jgi:hypothetical protein
VTADDGDESGELREHEFPESILARVHHVDHHRHHRGKVLHAVQSERLEDVHDTSNNHVVMRSL